MVYGLIVAALLQLGNGSTAADAVAFASIRKVGEVRIGQEVYASKSVDQDGLPSVKVFSSPKNGFVVVAHGSKDGTVAGLENKKMSPDALRLQLVGLGVVKPTDKISILCCYPMMVAREVKDARVSVLFPTVTTCIRLSRNFGYDGGDWPVLADEDY